MIIDCLGRHTATAPFDVSSAENNIIEVHLQGEKYRL